MHFVDARGILSARNGMNIYRGCTHGCIYCAAAGATDLPILLRISR